MAAVRKSLYWREAASLILTKQRKTNNIIKAKPQDTDFDVLMLKRGKKSSFMANVYVFPGGVVSDSDFDTDGWSPIFNKTTASSMAAITREFQIQAPRPPMMEIDKAYPSTLLHPDVAFRICAIRETFEESGVLLVTHKTEFENLKQNCIRSRIPKVHIMPQSFQTNLWRQRVSDDARAFQDLCREYDVVPNIWSLFEWSNWLTPVFSKIDKPPKKPKRFDTIFYLCCLDSNEPQSESNVQNEEISSVEWDTPESWYSRGQSKEITLVGPQFYETSRLTLFRESCDLVAYARKREPHGMERWMSVSYICSDGIFFTLPGDEMYPADPDYEGTRDITVLPGPVLSYCYPAKRYHRGIRGSWDYYCNIALPYGLIKQRYAKDSFPNKLDFIEAKI